MRKDLLVLMSPVLDIVGNGLFISDTAHEMVSCRLFRGN